MTQQSYVKIIQIFKLYKATTEHKIFFQLWWYCWYHKSGLLLIFLPNAWKREFGKEVQQEVAVTGGLELLEQLGNCLPQRQ